MKTEQFQPATSNFGATIMQSVNLMRGKNVSNFSIVFLDPTEKHSAGQHQSFYMPNIVFGRGSKCHVKYGDNYKTVSREHASITSNGNQQYLNHNSSAKNPTLVNGNPISGTHLLQNGDEIQFSHDGPKVRYNTSQVKTSTIGVTSRIGSAVGQALKPYKNAVRILGLLLLSSLAFGGYNMYKSNQLSGELSEATSVISYLEDEASMLDEKMKNMSNKSNANYQKLLRDKNALQKQITDLKKNPTIVERYTEEKDKDNSNVYRLGKTNNTNTKSTRANASSDDVGGVADRGQGYENSQDDWVDNNNKEIVDHNILPKPDVFLLLCKRIEVSYKGKTEPMGVEKFYAYDVDNPLSENRDAILLGTGFVDEGGDLYTARHVVQPWRFVNPNAPQSFKDLMMEINLLETNGADVSLYFDAFSKEGKEHAFNTKNMRFDDSKDEFIQLDKKYKLEYFKPLSKKVDQKFKKTTENFSDWAKINFQNIDSEIKISRGKSEKLKTGTKLHCLGFSNGLTFQSARRRVDPLYSVTTVAQDYTLDGVINTSGLPFGSGNSGGPAMVYKNGEFIAVGIITAGLDGNACIVPIQRVR